MGKIEHSTADERRDIDMANVSDNLSDLGDKTSGTRNRNIEGGSGGVQGLDASGEGEAGSSAREQSDTGGRDKGRR